MRKECAKDLTAWARKLPLVLMAIRSAPHSVFQLSPHYLLFGREPSLRADAFPRQRAVSSNAASRIRANLELARRVTAAEWSKLKKRKSRETTQNGYDQYELGDMVNLRNHQKSKLQQPLVGPFVVSGHDHRGYMLESPVFRTRYSHPKDMFRIPEIEKVVNFKEYNESEEVLVEEVKQEERKSDNPVRRSERLRQNKR